MRRAIGFVLIVLGVVALALAGLARPVLYDRLATVRLDQKSTSVSVGENMSALRASVVAGVPKVEVLRGVTLQSTRQVRGIPGKVKGKSGDNTFWQTGVTSEAVGIGQLSFTQEGVSFDRRTALSTNCCGDFISRGDLDDPSKVEPIRHEGVVFKFPFDTQKKTYPFWDGELGRAEPMKYVATEKIEGVTVYKFQQVSGPETTAQRPGVPGSLFGQSAPVDAELVYENTRTLWIEPNTGVIIKGQEELNRRLEAPGLDSVPVTVGTIGYSDKTVKANAEEWGTKGALLKALQVTVPVGGLLLGLVLLVGGLLLVRGSRGGGARRQDAAGEREAALV